MADHDPSQTAAPRHLSSENTDDDGAGRLRLVTSRVQSIGKEREWTLKRIESMLGSIA